MNHYDVLGVSSEAKTVVIKAAYRALSKKYHPDTAELPLAVAEERMKAVNVAYGVLSDSGKKADYDKALSDEDEFDYDDYREFTAAFEEDTREAWNLSIEYFPEVERLYEELARLSEPLANTFRLSLIVSKGFDKATIFARNLETEYLKRLFGDDTHVRQFGKRLMLSGNREAARELNIAVSTFGNSIKPQRLIESITTKHLRDSNEAEQEVKVPRGASQMKQGGNVPLSSHSSGFSAGWVFLGGLFLFVLVAGLTN
jgi:curved DNA-binding protein CbpA